MKPVTHIFLCLATAALTSVASPAAGETNSALTRVEYFYEEGCTVCFRVTTEILPQVEARYADLVELRRYETGIESNYLRLAGYQERFEIDDEATAIFVLDGRQVFGGWSQISTGLLDAVDQAISQAAAGAAAAPLEPEPVSVGNLNERVRRFTVLGVAAAGLVDGINPCAISTLIFFISMLGVMRVRGRRLVMAGMVFCIVSFLTYIGIGFGLFRVLYLFVGFRTLQSGLEWVMIVLLAVLAWLSFRDAWRFHVTGKPEAVTLKLPRRVGDAIHRVIRGGLHTRHILWGSVATAFLVTVLESVCTGQVYVPTLVLVLRSGESTLLVVGYLLLYNTLFIVPLVVALWLAYRGTTTERLLQWSRRHVVPGKIVMGSFFIGLAILILML